MQQIPVVQCQISLGHRNSLDTFPAAALHGLHAPQNDSFPTYGKITATTSSHSVHHHQTRNIK